MIDLLILLLWPALQCVEGGKWWLFPFAIVAFVVDVVLAHTTWVLVAGFPKKNEWTVSDTLERLCLDFNNPDQELFIHIAKKINSISPSGHHIKAI